MYDCFYLDKVPEDVTRFRNLYLAYDKIDLRSFNGVGEVIAKIYFYFGSLKSNFQLKSGHALNGSIILDHKNLLTFLNFYINL